jgi:methionyl-tRNA synthetase
MMRVRVAQTYGDRRSYVIVPGYPTPNGALHLGHLGGPYLRADALRRYLESRGHQVVTIGASDSWESNILYTAAAEGRSPARVVTRYHTAIKRVLDDFDLLHEEYLDIHEPGLAGDHLRHSDELVAALAADGRIAYRHEQLLVDQATGRILVGCWLTGRCPQCGAGAVGNSCESCGLWFGPLDMVGAASRAQPAGTLSTIGVTSAFATAAEQMSPERCASRIGHSDTYLRIVEDYWKWNPTGIRLSYPIGWGLPWPTSEADHGSVHYSYGTLLWSASKLIGEAAASRLGAGNPFSQDSQTVTVAVGGIDAVMPWLVLLGLATDSADFRPYDFFIFNHFLNLHGSKFSTSRRHVIWAADYIAAGLDTDCVRLYLAGICPQTDADDFRCDAFASFAAVWSARLEDAVRIDAAPEAHDGPAGDASDVHTAVMAALAAQDRCIALPDADIRAAMQVLDDWLTRSPQYRQADVRRWYLWCLAILAAPFVPRWSQRLWDALGIEGRPNVWGSPADLPPGASLAIPGLRAPREDSVRRLMEAPSLDVVTMATVPSPTSGEPA